MHTKSRSKKIMNTVLTILLLIVAIFVVFTIYTSRLNSSFDVTYVARGVSVDIQALYRVGTVGETRSGGYSSLLAEGQTVMIFDAQVVEDKSATLTKTFDPIGDQKLSRNEYFVMRYTILNNKIDSLDMLIAMDVEKNKEPENIRISYASTKTTTDLSTNLAENRQYFSDTFEQTELKRGEVLFLYMIFEIINPQMTASFTGTNNWIMTALNVDNIE